MDNIDNSSKNFKNSNKDYIDLNLFLLSIKRNTNLIFIITFIGALCGLIIGFTEKKVWKGEFQIVIDTNLSSSSMMSGLDTRLLQLTGLNKNKRLETEVAILNSPSVLMNVFEFVKTKKSLDDNKSNIRFKDWKEAKLDINLKERTSILGITYKDNNKELILPVLNRISKEYQKYSGKRRLREIELGIGFFENQIKIYKERSKNSLNEVQTFALDNSLSTKDYLLDNFTSFDNENSKKNNLTFANPLNFSSLKVEIGNKIKVLERQINLIKDFENKSERIIYIASTIPEIRQEEIFENLNAIDIKLSQLRLSYKEEDREIKETLIEKDILLNLLKKQVEGYFYSERNNLLAALKSIERPRDILIKYNELVRNSKKDIATLDSLENNYRKILLEKARLEDPWQLITKPTLYPYHISPNKKRLLFFGTFTGLIVGILAGFINDKRKDIIFSVDELDLFENLSILTCLSLSEPQNFDENIEIIFKGPLSNLKEDISFFIIGQKELPFLDKIKIILENKSKQKKIKITNNFLEAIEFKNIVIIIVLGNTKIKEIKNVSQKLLLQKNNILGSIVIKDK